MSVSINQGQIERFGERLGAAIGRSRRLRPPRAESAQEPRTAEPGLRSAQAGPSGLTDAVWLVIEVAAARSAAPSVAARRRVGAHTRVQWRSVWLPVAIGGAASLALDAAPPPLAWAIGALCAELAARRLTELPADRRRLGHRTPPALLALPRVAGSGA